MNSPIYYETLDDKYGTFTVLSGSKFLQAMYVFDELRVYFLANEGVKGITTYNYAVENTGDYSPNNMEHVLTFNPDRQHVFHLFVDKEFVEHEGVFALPMSYNTYVPNVASSSTTPQPTVVSADKHKDLSFIYRKQDGSTRLVRLARFVTGVNNEGRQYFNGLDYERDGEFRTFYLDMIEEWVTVDG